MLQERESAGRVKSFEMTFAHGVGTILVGSEVKSRHRMHSSLVVMLEHTHHPSQLWNRGEP